MAVVFVCWGNICRSPLAEHFYRQIVMDQLGCADGADGTPVTASFGLIAEEGDQPIAETVAAGRRRGVDVAGHRARRFESGRVPADALLVVMEREHRRLLIEEHGIEPARVRLLLSWISGGPDDAEVEDPGGGPEAGFTFCVEQIERAVRALVAEHTEKR